MAVYSRRPKSKYVFHQLSKQPNSFQGKPHVKLSHDGQEKLIPPEAISAEVLKEMKAVAEVRMSEQTE